MNNPATILENTRMGPVHFSRSAVEGLTEFRYKSYHIPSGSKFDRRVWCAGLAEFDSLLDRWNGLGGSVWRYVAV